MPRYRSLRDFDWPLIAKHGHLNFVIAALIGALAGAAI